MTERIEAGEAGECVALRLEPFRLAPSVEQVARYFGGARYAPKADARRRIAEGIRHALGLIEPAASLAFHVVADAPCDGVLHLANGLSLDLPESLREGPTPLSLQREAASGDGSRCRPSQVNEKLAECWLLSIAKPDRSAPEQDLRMLAAGIATLGNGLEDHCRTLAQAREIYRSTLIDAIGNAMLDLLGGWLRSMIEEQAKSRGLFLGRRFSPGLEGYPLERQQMLFQLARGDAAGVRLNQACVMEPVKSMSFFRLLTAAKNSGEPLFKCRACRLPHCRYRLVH